MFRTNAERGTIAVKKEVTEGKLVPLAYEVDSPSYMQIFYHKDKWVSPALADFIKIVEE